VTQRDRGFKLRSRDGHFEMVEFDLKRVEGGYWMWVECKFDGHNGGHWLAPDPSKSGAITMIYDPYIWPDPVTAFDARDRWEAQQSRENR
jgi:hypothetical protein